MKHVYFLVLLLTALVTSCATKPGAPASKNTTSGFKLLPADNQHFSDLIDFYENYSNATPEVQKKLYTEIQQTLTLNANDVLHRIKLASMLALPSSDLKDHAKAQNLLQELLQDKSLGKLELGYVGLLYEFNTENIKQQQKIKDETKKADGVDQKYDVLQKKQDALQKKYEALEQKLNDLKNIEKTISDRDAKPSDTKSNGKTNP